MTSKLEQDLAHFGQDDVDEYEAFDLCDRCSDPLACEEAGNCWHRENPSKPGFNFTQEEEDFLNDPRRG